MTPVTGNLWDYPATWRGITTNGFIKRNGANVMGRGCALEATQRYPTLPQELGLRLRTHGNLIHWFPDYQLFTFPVKHSWEQDASIELIANSASQLDAIARQHPEAIYVLPRPGCGNGRLSWLQVEPILRGLPDNVHVITFA